MVALHVRRAEPPLSNSMFVAPRLLIVGGDSPSGHALVACLKAGGFYIRAVRSGLEAINQIREGFDAVLSELDLSDMTALDLMQHVKMNGDVPFLLLSIKDDIEVKIKAFECGVDDFIQRPFYDREVLARLRVVLRRRKASNSAEQLFSIDGLCVDLQMRRVAVHGKEVHLSPKEFNIIQLMVRHAGKVLNPQHPIICLLVVESRPPISSHLH